MKKDLFIFFSDERLQLLFDTDDVALLLFAVGDAYKLNIKGKCFQTKYNKKVKLTPKSWKSN